jgi:hypothetical protein
LSSECRCYSFKAEGHPNIRATHRSTLEVTTEEFLTPRGDCIIGIKAQHGASGLPEDLKEALRKGWSACLVIRVKSTSDILCGKGDPRLTFSSNTRMIFRKSHYVEPATVFVGSDKSAKDINRSLVEELSRGNEAWFTLIVYPPEE